MVGDIPTDLALYGFCLGLSLVLAVLGAFSGPSQLFDIDGTGALDGALPGNVHSPTDHGLAPDADPGIARYSLLNPISFLSLLGGFGASGLIARGLGAGVWPSLIAALAAGMALSVLLFQLFTRVVLSSEAAPAQSPQAMVGRLATVTVGIPAGGLGAVAYVLAGRRETISARHQEGTPLPSGTEVVIVDLDRHVAVVTPFARQ